MPAQPPGGSREPLVVFLTFFTLSVTPDAVTLRNKTRQSGCCHPPRGHTCSREQTNALAATQPRPAPDLSALGVNTTPFLPQPRPPVRPPTPTRGPPRILPGTGAYSTQSERATRESRNPSRAQRNSSGHSGPGWTAPTSPGPGVRDVALASRVSAPRPEPSCALQTGQGTDCWTEAWPRGGGCVAPGATTSHPPEASRDSHRIHLSPDPASLDTQGHGVPARWCWGIRLPGQADLPSFLLRSCPEPPRPTRSHRGQATVPAGCQETLLHFLP